MEVKRVVNSPVDSNSYIIHHEGKSGCIVIDPGTLDCNNLLDYMSEHKLVPDYIFLTHEHFDHILGVNKLKEMYSCRIICTRACDEKIIDRKKNMSVFYDQVGFESYRADIIIENINGMLLWNEMKIEFIDTKGHTNGSMCVYVEDKLFTGDTIIKNHKTVVKFPSGSRLNLMFTLDLLFDRFKGMNLIVYPGHGESFYWDEISIGQIV